MFACISACVICACVPTHKHWRCVHTACVLLFVCVSCHIHSLMVPTIDCFSSWSAPRAGRKRFGLNNTYVMHGNLCSLRALERPKSWIFNKLLIIKNPELVLCRIQMSVAAVCCLWHYSRALIVQIMMFIQNISDSDHLKKDSVPSLICLFFESLIIHPLYAILSLLIMMTTGFPITATSQGFRLLTAILVPDEFLGWDKQAPPHCWWLVCIQGWCMQLCCRARERSLWYLSAQLRPVYLWDVCQCVTPSKSLSRPSCCWWRLYCMINIA